MTSSGVLISGLMWVIGRQLYISQAQVGHLTRSSSVLPIRTSFPQSMQMNRPGPGFSPAFAVVLVPGSATGTHQSDHIVSKYLAVSSRARPERAPGPRRAASY